MLATLAELYEQRWTRQEELLAELIEVVDVTSWRGVNLKKGARPKLLQVPRPGRGPRRKRRKASPEETQQVFRQLLA